MALANQERVGKAIEQLRDYERRFRDAYPVHPELFDRLCSDWSAPDRFQRTRGVRRPGQTWSEQSPRTARP